MRSDRGERGGVSSSRFYHTLLLARSLRFACRDPSSATDSSENKALSCAISKAEGDCDKAIKNICRLYGVKNLEALPEAIKFRSY